MSDKNGVAIGDRLLITREFNHDFYLVLGTVLGVKEEIDEEDNTSFVIYDVQLPDGKITRIDEVDVMGHVVNNVPYLLIKYFVLDFANYEVNEGKKEEFKPSKPNAISLPTLPTPINERFIEFSSYNNDELLDAYNQYSALKDDEYFATILTWEIIPELKKRGGSR